MTKTWSLWFIAGMLFLTTSLSQIFMYPPFTEVKWGIFAIAFLCISLVISPWLKGWTGLISVVGTFTALCLGLGVFLGMNRERGSWVLAATLATTIVALVVLGIFSAKKNFGASLILLGITCLVGACASAFLVAGFGFYPRNSYSGIPDLPALAVIFTLSFMIGLWASSRFSSENQGDAKDSVLLGVLRSPLRLFVPSRFV